MNTPLSSSHSQSAVTSASQESTAEAKPSPVVRRFPTLPIHPEVVEGLRRETARLSRLENWRFISQYDPFDTDVILKTLIGLEGPQEPFRSLSPRSSFDRKRLVEQGIGLVRFWWRILGKEAFTRYYEAKKHIAFSLDELDGDSSMPYVENCAIVPTGAISDLLIDPTVSQLITRLRSRKGIDEGRAILLILELLEGERKGGTFQRELYDTVQSMGYTLASFEAMRKWLTRKKREVRPDLQNYIKELIGGLPADRALRSKGASSEGPSVFSLLIRKI